MCHRTSLFLGDRGHHVTIIPSVPAKCFSFAGHILLVLAE